MTGKPQENSFSVDRLNLITIGELERQQKMDIEASTLLPKTPACSPDEEHQEDISESQMEDLHHAGQLSEALAEYERTVPTSPTFDMIEDVQSPEPDDIVDWSEEEEDIPPTLKRKCAFIDSEAEESD